MTGRGARIKKAKVKPNNGEPAPVPKPPLTDYQRQKNKERAQKAAATRARNKAEKEAARVPPNGGAQNVRRLYSLQTVCVAIIERSHRKREAARAPPPQLQTPRSSSTSLIINASTLTFSLQKTTSKTKLDIAGQSDPSDTDEGAAVTSDEEFLDTNSEYPKVHPKPDESQHGSDNDGNGLETTESHSEDGNEAPRVAPEKLKVMYLPMN